jgi:SAM-dependent methyltransferase
MNRVRDVAANAPMCPFCGASSRFALTAFDRNREITSERFTYHRCDGCGTVFMVDVPADLEQYYAGTYYGFDESGVPHWRGNEFLGKVESYRMRLIRRHVEPGRLIEIGAGAGGFAAAANDAGFDVTAIEMDARCCEYLRNDIGVNATQSNQPVSVLGTLPTARAVAMWHVLEHVPNPTELLAAAAARVEPGGVMAIGVPNPQSLQFRLLGTRWAHLDAPRHLCLIPADALIERARELGLRPLAVTTDDPFGRHCNMHGWTYALRRRPAVGPAPVDSHAGVAITRLMRRIERRGENGSALLLLLGRDHP